MTEQIPRICSFESRRAQEMENLILKLGGSPVVAPSMREVPLEANTVVRSFAEQLHTGEIDIVIFMTGVGANTLFDAVRLHSHWEQFHADLDQTTIIVRGPKPVPVLKQAKIHIDHRAPEPNTWREILSLLDDVPVSVRDQTVAVQEYGKANSDFYDEMELRGARVVPVPVYRWELPEDTTPLVDAIREAIEQPFDLVLFTSANQVDNVLEIADRHEIKTPLLSALSQSNIASIGPTCTERLKECGLKVNFEPTHPKMGHLVRESIEFVANQTS